MSVKRRYLIVMEVESDIELDRGGPPFSVSPRWSLFDVYPNITSENYRDPSDLDKHFELDLVEICSIKDMGEADD